MTKSKVYAKGTKTAIADTEHQIKAMLRKHGAESVASGETAKQAQLAFHLQGRSIRFTLPLPARDERRFTHAVFGARGEQPRTAAAAGDAWIQGCRERWRALHLCIKAKLESVEQNIETFDDAFLSQIVTPDGETVGDKMRTGLPALMDGKPLRPLLGGPS